MNSKVNGLRLASHVKLSVEYNKLAIQLSNYPKISALFNDVTHFYMKSIRKRFKYLSISEKNKFYKYLNKIDSLNDLQNKDFYFSLISISLFYFKTNFCRCFLQY